jgi:hypothetical protein
LAAAFGAAVFGAAVFEATGFGASVFEASGASASLDPCFRGFAFTADARGLAMLESYSCCRIDPCGRSG